MAQCLFSVKGSTQETERFKEFVNGGPGREVLDFETILNRIGVEDYASYDCNSDAELDSEYSSANGKSLEVLYNFKASSIDTAFYALAKEFPSLEIRLAYAQDDGITGDCSLSYAFNGKVINKSIPDNRFLRFMFEVWELETSRIFEDYGDDFIFDKEPILENVLSDKEIIKNLNTYLTNKEEGKSLGWTLTDFIYDQLSSKDYSKSNLKKLTFKKINKDLNACGWDSISDKKVISPKRYIEQGGKTTSDKEAKKDEGIEK